MNQQKSKFKIYDIVAVKEAKYAIRIDEVYFNSDLVELRLAIDHNAKFKVIGRNDVGDCDIHNIYIMNAITHAIYLHSEKFLTLWEEPKETFPVETPISLTGNILFNNNYSLMSYTATGLQVRSSNIQFEDAKDKFVWQKVKREDLICGDTAYRVLNDYCNSFSNKQAVCKIVDDKTHCLVSGDRTINFSSIYYKHWHKLIRKDIHI